MLSFFTTPDTEEPVVLYEKDWEFRKTTYDQEEMNDETDIEIAQECMMDYHKGGRKSRNSRRISGTVWKV